MIDFSEFKGKTLTLAHTTLWVDTDHLGSDKVMQFRVSSTVTDNSNNGPLPAKLVNVQFPKDLPAVTQTFNFARNIGQPWTINGRPFSDVSNRIIAKPQLGTIEKYILRGNGGWSHPIHMHLVDFQLLSRSYGNPNQAPGRTYLEEYEKGAIKDVAVLGENEALTVLAKYVPFDGVYVGIPCPKSWNINALTFKDVSLSQYCTRRLCNGRPSNQLSLIFANFADGGIQHYVSKRLWVWGRHWWARRSDGSQVQGKAIFFD